LSETNLDTLFHFRYTYVVKMKSLNIIQKLKSLNLLIFTPREFKNIFNLSDKTARVYISRNLKTGLFEKLRSGLYILKDSSPSPYQIANRLYQPSYISLDKALAHYGMIPETVFSVTSITTKPTREFTTECGLYIYQTIKLQAFTGYRLVNLDGQDILMAEPEKALVDYLYFVSLGKIELSDRINLNNLSKNKVLSFAKLFNRPKLNRLIEQIYASTNNAPTIY